MKRLVILLCSLLLCSTLFAGEIKEIVFIGDSLSDSGNLYEKIKVIPKSPPYYKGRFSNGPTWAENVGKFYYDKSFIDFHNYAVGGATAFQHNPLKDGFAPPITLTGEIYDYLLRSLFVNKSEVLYVIWIGANDYLYNTKTSDMDETSSQVIENISWAVDTLAGYGAKNFLLLNLPDLAVTPYATDSNLKNELHKVTLMHNTKLANAVKNLHTKYSHVKIAFIDVYGIFNDLLNNPQKFNQLYGKNITNMTQACWQGSMMLRQNILNENALTSDIQKSLLAEHQGSPKDINARTMAKTILSSPSLAEVYYTSKLAENGVQPCSNADQYIFWDHIHPTDSVHQVFAKIVENNLSDIDI